MRTKKLPKTSSMALGKLFDLSEPLVHYLKQMIVLYCEITFNSGTSNSGFIGKGSKISYNQSACTLFTFQIIRVQMERKGVLMCQILTEGA